MWTYTKDDVPLVVINLLADDISLSKGEVMCFMQNQSLDISEIVTETSMEPSPLLLQENNDMEVLQGKVEERISEIEKKFITSPADIEVHQKSNYKMLTSLMSNKMPLKHYVVNSKISFQ